MRWSARCGVGGAWGRTEGKHVHAALGQCGGWGRGRAYSLARKRLGRGALSSSARCPVGAPLAAPTHMCKNTHACMRAGSNTHMGFHELSRVYRKEGSVEGVQALLNQVG